MEAIRLKFPTHKIVLSFFSPSGYEAFKNWSGADVVCYIPLDTKTNAKEFVDCVSPETVIFIKYEFWLYFLFELKARNIPTYLVSAVFKAHHPFFKWYGSIFRKSLGTFTKLFVQDEPSGNLLNSIGISNYEIAGDTRFDRVLKVKENFTELEVIKKFKAGQKLIIAGSTWPGDEDLVLKAFVNLKPKSAKLILVPHEVDEKSLQKTIERVKKQNLSYALYHNGVVGDEQVLIVDVMGILSKVYHYADVAYIGGGFNGGLHNTLEAAVYGVPVTFYGEAYIKYNEVMQMKKEGTAFRVNNEEELSGLFSELLQDKEKREVISEKLDVFFGQNAYATQKILNAVLLVQ